MERSKPPDLNEIAIFARVVQSGSFTGAARELGLPKSTVSRKVSELEGRLAARLLQRTTRRLGLTDAGRALYEYAARIVADVEEAGRAVNRLQETPRGLLRVTAPVSLGFLGRMIGSFLAKYPEVQVDMVCTDRLVDLVEEGFDLALRAGKLADSALVSRPLSTFHSLVVAAPQYLEQRPAPVSPEALRQHDCLLFGPGAARNTWLLEDGKRRVEVAVPARLVVNDVDLLHDATLAAQGIALLPDHACWDDLRDGRLVRVLPNWRALGTPFQAVFPSTRHLSPKVKVFVDHLAAAMKSSGSEQVGRRTERAGRSRTPK